MVRCNRITCTLLKIIVRLKFYITSRLFPDSCKCNFTVIFCQGKLFIKPVNDITLITAVLPAYYLIEIQIRIVSLSRLVKLGELMCSLAHPHTRQMISRIRIDSVGHIAAFICGVKVNRSVKLPVCCKCHTLLINCKLSVFEYISVFVCPVIH